MIKVSVAIATFNGKNIFLQKQLESVLNQTLKIDEVIISDDLSTDGTLECIEKFIEDNNLENTWKVYRNCETHGVIYNFYNAISHTTGDLVLLCDQDDIWSVDKAQRLVEIFMHNSQIRCINTSFIYIDKDDKEMEIQQKTNTSNNNLILHHIMNNKIEYIPLSLVINKNISPGMTMAVHREVINLYLKHSKKMYLHDWEINCIAATIGGLYFINVPLVKYRIHENQTVSIENIRKRKKYEILSAKLNDNKNMINLLTEMIDTCHQISQVKQDKTNIKFIKDFARFIKVRYGFVYHKKIINIFLELKEYTELIYKYGGKRHSIDIRYFVIDILSFILQK